MYPDADIPTVEMSINRKLDMQQHYEMGKKLYRFREEGIRILCTGNVVHNLTMVNMSGSPYKWAISCDEKVKKYITSGKRHVRGVRKIKYGTVKFMRSGQFIGSTLAGKISKSVS
jgi:aromatic ring-opening dioxygenase catalytic subunit (LigB family)